MEFGIGVRGPKCLNDGPTRWYKKFSDRFSRFDTIPAVTDTQPATQPPSHVAIAITLNAKASSLKTVRFRDKVTEEHTNRKPYTIYRMIPLSMTLSEPRFQCHDIFKTLNIPETTRDRAIVTMLLAL